MKSKTVVRKWLSTLVVAVLATGVAVTVGTPAQADAVAVDGPTTGDLKDFESAASPVISGTATVGQELTVEPGVWTPDTSFEFQWLADGVAVPGATVTTLPSWVRTMSIRRSLLRSRAPSSVTL